MPALAVIVEGAPTVFVNEKFTVVRPVAIAVTVYGPPAVELAVNGAAATPEAFVATTIVAVLLLNMPDAPAPGAVNVTFTPDTGLLPESRTVTASAFAKAVLTTVDCGVVPALAVIVAGGPTMFVNAKLLVTGPAVTNTLYEPMMELAVKVVAVAKPAAVVVVLVVFVVLANRPLFTSGFGAVKTTVSPLITTLPASRTVACNVVANAVFTAVLWPLPAVSVMLAATWFTVTVSELLAAAVPRFK